MAPPVQCHARASGRCCTAARPAILTGSEWVSMPVERPGLEVLLFTWARTFAACSLSTLPRSSARPEVLPTARSADSLCRVRPESRRRRRRRKPR